MPDNEKPEVAKFRSDPKFAKDNQFLRDWLEAELTERAQAAQQPKPQGTAMNIWDAMFRKVTSDNERGIFSFFDDLFGSDRSGR